MVLRVLTIGDCPDRSRSPIFERNEQSREASRDVLFMAKSAAAFQMLCKTNGLSAGVAYYDIALAYSWFLDVRFDLTSLAERGVQFSRWPP